MLEGRKRTRKPFFSSFVRSRRGGICGRLQHREKEAAEM
jgi:hypothetical protein